MKIWDKEHDGDVARTPEDRINICKLLQHAIDYCKAVKHYGQDFYKHPATKPRYQDNWVYENGMLARSYFFDESTDGYSARNLCQHFGWNLNAMRRRLNEMTPDRAAMFGNFYAHWVHENKRGKTNETTDKAANKSPIGDSEQREL